MRYNAAEVPTKMGTFSQYQYPHALARYAELGRLSLIHISETQKSVIILCCIRKAVI